MQTDSRRMAVRRIAVVALLLALAFACQRAPLRGPDVGAEDDPYLPEGYAAPEPSSSDPAHRLILIGDAGAPTPDDPTLALLGAWGDAHPERSTVLFLGDNVYPAGLRDEERARDEAILRQQLDATRARKVFLPGNHDWGFAWNRMLAPGVLANQETFVEAQPGADFEPEGGCPGPVALELMQPGERGVAGGLTVLAVDLHWWLLDEDERPDCGEVASTADFIERLRGELEARRSQNVVIAGHHPIRSGGPHGGHTRGFWFDQAIGLWYRIYTAQDLMEPGYREMVSVLSEVLAEYEPLAMVAGHDHSLQILDGGDEAELVIVSGAGSKVSSVTWTEDTLFAHAHRGFIVLDFHASEQSPAGFVRAEVVETGREESVASFVLDLSKPEAEPRSAPARSSPD